MLHLSTKFLWISPMNCYSLPYSSLLVKPIRIRLMQLCHARRALLQRVRTLLYLVSKQTGFANGQICHKWLFRIQHRIHVCERLGQLGHSQSIVLLTNRQTGTNTISIFIVNQTVMNYLCSFGQERNTVHHRGFHTLPPLVPGHIAIVS